ncbi:MAG: hypothetical protein DMD81_24740 [Candidatus Rokuibacteriota bacterium]|nr:MAG: hypothetical protein DMD81_24740 [Candidatus Rokubacteria bacterium]
MIHRRAFLIGLVTALTGIRASVSAEQRPARQVPRIALLSPSRESAQNVARMEVEAGLRQLGWKPGENVIVDGRTGAIDRLPELAAELVRLKVDMILASSEALPAARAATATIPILMTFCIDDPVEAGYVMSLGHPGTNITGIFLQAPEAGGKRLEFLRAAIPNLRRVAVVSWRGRNSAKQIDAVETAGGSLGVRVQVVEMNDRSTYDSAFGTMGKEGVKAALVLASAVSFTERPRIIELAARHRIALAAPFREYAEAGALIGYGANIRELWRERVPLYVDRILRGARPADMPVEQPTKFELVLNLKTAKTLGLSIPPSLLARANDVIQ